MTKKYHILLTIINVLCWYIVITNPLNVTDGQFIACLILACLLTATYLAQLFVYVTCINKKTSDRLDSHIKYLLRKQEAERRDRKIGLYK